MNVEMASDILKEHQNLNKWGQSVIFDTGVDFIDLSVCFRPNPTQPQKISVHLPLTLKIPPSNLTSQNIKVKSHF